MTEKEAITPFDSWWDQFGKAILNRHHCAKAARKEGVKEQERRQWQSQTLVAERDEWRNMVAVLCGDGGHYHAKHGTAATRAHIEKKLFDLREQHDKMVAAVTWIAEQEEHICEDCNLREGILSRCKAALLKEETT